MFARNVSIRLKPDTLGEFVLLLEQQVLPILRIQPGFRDQITLASEGGASVAIIDIWDTKAQAGRYDTTAYLGVLQQLAHVLDGTPIVQAMPVISSTVHHVAGVRGA